MHIKSRIFFIFCFIFLLSTSTSFSSEIVVNESSFDSSYSGVYEAIFKKKRSGSIITKKYLVRLHLFRNQYGTSRHFTRNLDGSLNTHRKPKYLFGKIEEFDNKNGKGEPKVTYFRGVSDEKENELKMELFPKIRSMKRFVTIPKMGINEEKELEIFKDNKWPFKKVGSYHKRPAIFDEYFQRSLSQYIFKNSYTKEQYLQLGNSGYRGIKLLTEDFKDHKDTLRVILKNARISSSEAEDFDWIRGIKGGVLKVLLDNSNTSTSELVVFLPEAKYLKMYVNTPMGSKQYDESNHFFGAKIMRDDSGVKVKFAETARGKDYRIRANKLDNEKAIAMNKKATEMIIAREKAEKEARKEFLRVMAEKTATGEPTEKQMKYAMFQKYNPGKQKEKLWMYINRKEFLEALPRGFS